MAQNMFATSAKNGSILDYRLQISQNTTFPYVLLNISSKPHNTKSTRGMEHTLRVQVFSLDKAQGYNLQKLIIEALDAQESNISIDNLVQYIFSGMAISFLESDGKVFNNTFEFNVIIDN
jgi:hypothetical protein